MNRLEEEGFARSVPYKGTTVAPLTIRDFEEIRELRNMLERWAGSLIISRNLTSDLSQIELAYATMWDAAKGRDAAAVDSADLAFHTLICQLSGNSLLLEVWNRYANRFRWVLTYCNRVNEDLDQIVNKHEPLLQAFRQRDKDALRRFYSNHPTDLTPFLPEELMSTS
jgi:DNA-binding GntR family transcriptional regulator